VLMAALLLFCTCGSGDDDDDDDDDDVADDDDDDDDDTDDDDDDSGPNRPPQPYTPCCNVSADDVAMSDPGIAASEPGPYFYFRIDREFEDAERERVIPAYIYLPSADGQNPAAESAPFPLVLVVHGFSGNREMMIRYGERLATWGYIAVVPSLPYTNPLYLFKMNHVESAKDLLFVLNAICCEHEQEGSAFHNLVDRTRLAAVGHSMGGKLSTLASWMDGGLRTVFGLDPVDGAGPITADTPEFPRMTPERVQELQIPTLYCGSERGGEGMVPCAPEDLNYHQFWLFSPPPSVEITFIGADHTDFIPDMPLDPCDLGSADPEIVKALSYEYSIAWLNFQLRGWERFKDDYSGTGIAADQQAGYVTWQEK